MHIFVLADSDFSPFAHNLVDLLALLKWKNNQENLSQVLEQVKRLDGEELVKFLQDILDALFSMFATEDGRSTENSGRVFANLVCAFI